MAQSNRHRSIIIGAGSAGICMGISLKNAGIEDFVILEKADEIGGTWFWNRYPGAGCDVQSHLYSFSFEQNNDWSQPFAGQEEILAYLNFCADKYGVRDHVRFNTAVTAAHWQDDQGHWRLTTGSGERFEAQSVISALGMFNKLVMPAIPGVDEFEGTYFHSARWNHDHDLSGERVGVIGIAASAIQFVPEIAPIVGQLHLYQRTANWVVPKPNTPYTEKERQYFRHNPDAVKESRDEIYNTWNTLCTFKDKKVLAEIEKAGLERIEIVKDPEVRRKLTPNHPFGCKRPLFSDVYYPVFNRDNVELLNGNIERITSNSIVTVDGEAREVDTIIYSTGFETTTYLTALDVTGRNGRRLEDAWSDGPQAYYGMTTTGFPNLFMLYGPNTNQGCILFMLERQVEYITRQLKRMDDENIAWIDLRPEVMAAFNEQIQEDISTVDVWQAECGNDFYYRSSSGRLVTQWPHSMDAFTERTMQAGAEDYEVKVIG